MSLEQLYLPSWPPSCNLCYSADPRSRPDFRRSNFSQVLLHSNGTTTSETLNGFFVAQEVFLVIALVFTLFFYLTYLGRPPYGELDIVPPNKRREARRNSPAAWEASGFLGSFTYVLLAGAIFAVAILQVMWRLVVNPANGVYRAAGIMEVLLSVTFLVKLLLNVRVSPLTPGWKTFRNYAPVTISIFINLTIAILNLIICKSLVISYLPCLQAPQSSSPSVLWVVSSKLFSFTFLRPLCSSHPSTVLNAQTSRLIFHQKTRPSRA